MSIIKTTTSARDLHMIDEACVRKEPKVGEFGEHQATYLTEQLARVSLPNISNVEQMSLLAVIDTFIEVCNKHCHL